MATLRPMVAFPLIASLIGWHASHSLGHEGHKPLPTRGMEVDADSGKMTLARTAVEALDVRTAELGSQRVTQTITAYGELMSPWNQHALVSSPLPGRIVSLLVVPGQVVQAGQVLAEIESPELDQLQLDLRTAKLDLDLSRKLAESTETASRSGAIPRIRLIEAQSKLQRDQAVLSIATAKWRGLRLPDSSIDEILANPRASAVRRLKLSSPLTGVVSHSHLSVGKVVDTKEHLFEVRDSSKIWLQIGILEKDLAKVKAGQKIEASFTALPGETFVSSIDVVNPFLSPDRHVGIAWATFDNYHLAANRLLPGMTGQVKIVEVDEGTKLTIPVASVIRNGAERFVLVETEKTQRASSYQKQTVVLGRRFGDWIEVDGGQIFPGDNVVTQGSHELGTFFSKGVLRVDGTIAQDIQLETNQVERRSIGRTITVDGLLDVPPTHRTIAATQLPGKLEEIRVDRAQIVKRGDILATLYSQEFQNLQLDLLRTTVEAALQQATVETLLTGRESVSERQIVEAESRLNQLVSQRETAIQQLRNAGLTTPELDKLTASWELIESLPVRAPIDGVVVQFDKNLGHYIQTDEALFEIHDLSKAWVQAFLPERDLPLVQIGQRARVRFAAANAEVVNAVIARSGGAVGSDDQAVAVWLELTDMPSFSVQHNMLARVTIETGSTSPQIAVPRSAIVREGSRSYVFVRLENETFERRIVSTGNSDDLYIAIRDGLREGEIIATRGVTALQSGFAALR